MNVDGSNSGEVVYDKGIGDDECDLNPYFHCMVPQIGNSKGRKHKVVIFMCGGK